MKFTKPGINTVFTIAADPKWPSIGFETDGKGAHTWTWTIQWTTFKKTGTAKTDGNKWSADTVITNLGGTLTVQVMANNSTATITVKIKGTNPKSSEVVGYLAKTQSSAGFDKIIAQESKFVHFNTLGEPIKTFDNGFGMCQLTTPAPTFEKVWNWKLNVDGGIQLYEQKRTAAITYLSQSKRTYTTDQLKYEAVCRWNGGSYHDWDAKAGKWIRRTTILCDSKTGNIGWDMTDASNKGKTEAELHKRDGETYKKPPQANAHWKYSGVCYADHVLG